MKRRSLRDKVRKVFNSDIIDVCPVKQEIRVYFMRDPHGREWVPFSGGPLYDENAKSWAADKACQIEKFRCLLPKACRDWQIVCGELDARTYPGVFYPIRNFFGTV